jgi:hypothetical protein
MLLKNKKILPIGIIILIVLVMMGRYLMYGVPHEFLTGEYKGTFEGDYDFTLELVDSLKHWLTFPSWSQIYSGPISVFASNFHVFGQAFLYFFTHNQALSIKVYQAIYFVLAGIGMFLLADYIYQYWLTALFCAILYMFTPFFIGEMLSYLHYSTTYFCMPLVYLFILKALHSKEYIYYSLLAALIAAFNLLSHPQNMFIAGLFYFLFAIFIILRRLFQMLFKIKEPLRRMNFNKTLKIFSLIALVVILLSAFYLLPTFLNGYPYTRSLGEGGTWLKQLNKTPDAHSRQHSQSLISAVTLFHWPWFITPLKAEKYPDLFFMIIYALPFILSFLGLLLGVKTERKRSIQLLLFLGIISFLMSLGTRMGPFSLFSWAYKFIPFFHMGRTPYRFFYQAVLTICLLSGLSISRLPKKIIPIFSLLIIIPYLYGANYYGNNYNWTLIPSEAPKYFSLVQNWLENNNKAGHRIIETCGIPTSLGLNQRMLPNGLDLLERNLDKDYLDKILALFGFKYILAPTQACKRNITFDKEGYFPPRADDAQEDLEDPEEYYSALTTEYLFVYERLKKDPNFSLYTANTKDVGIFENKTAFDNYRLYPAKGVMVLGGINAYDFLDLDRFNAVFKENCSIKIAPIFIAQTKNLKNFAKIKQVCDELILHNTDSVDLFALLNQKYLINLSDFRTLGWNFMSQSFGIQQPLPYHDHSLGNFVFGDLSFSDFSLTTDKKDYTLEIPIEISKKDTYRIMLRTYGGEGCSNVSTYLNDQYLKQIESKVFKGFRWIELWNGSLQVGNYTLKITLDDYKPVYLDSAMVIPNSEFNRDDGYNNYLKDIFITYIINRQNIMRKGNSAITDLGIGRPGQYTFTIRLTSFAKTQVRGVLNLKIDSSFNSPIIYNFNKENQLNLAIDNVNLTKGRHDIEIKNLGSSVQLDFISISELKNEKNKFIGQDAAIGYKQDGPDSFRGRIRLNKPLILVHTETNYPGWKLKAGHKIIQPIITNMFLNGFIIDKTGEIKFKLFYLNTLKMTGGIISCLALISIILFLILRFNRLNKSI